MQLKWPFVLALVLIPVIFWILARRNKKPLLTYTAESAVLLKLPSFKKKLRKAHNLRRIESILFAAILLILLVIAARPQVPVLKVDEQKSHDIVVTLDVSGSMRKYAPDALQAMKEIILKNPSDRFAIVVFGGVGQPVITLTRDNVALLQTIDYLTGADGITSKKYTAATSLGYSIGNNKGTDVGAAVLASLQRFDNLQKERSRSIIMISDLESDSESDYLKIAPLVPKYKVKMFVLAPSAVFAQAQKSSFTTLTGAQVFELANQSSVTAVMQEVSKQILNKDQDKSFVLTDKPNNWWLLLMVLTLMWSVAVLWRWGMRR